MVVPEALLFTTMSFIHFITKALHIQSPVPISCQGERTLPVTFKILPNMSRKSVLIRNIDNQRATSMHA